MDKIIQKWEKGRSIKRYVLYFLFCILAMWPITQMGIACNDDLTWRMYASQGFTELAKAYYFAACGQGRVLSCIQIVSLWLSFFPCQPLYGMIKVFMFFINFILVAKILSKIYSKKAAMIFLVNMPILLQITLQFTPPDAFGMFMLLPFSYILLSIILFYNYLNERKCKYLVFSLILYFMSMCCYELFILMSPFFVLVLCKYLFDRHKFSFFNLYNDIKWHICTGIFYLLLYLGQRVIFPSSYDGNKIVLQSLSQMIESQRVLIFSGIPGIYSTTPNGKWLFKYGLGFPGTVSRDVIYKMLDVRFVFLLLVFMLLLYEVINMNAETISKKTHVISVLSVFTFIVCLPILNTLSANWRSVGTLEGVIGLPVSYVIEVFVVVLLSIIIYLVCELTNRKYQYIIKFIIIIPMLCWGGLVQIYNNIYSELQVGSYERIENMEALLKTDIMNFKDTISIYSPDMLSSYLMQCANEPYWQRYFSYNCDRFALVDDVQQADVFVRLYDSAEECIVFLHPYLEQESTFFKEAYFLSKYNSKYSFFSCKTKEGKYVSGELKSLNVDNGYWIYPIFLDEEMDANTISLMR